MTYIIVLNYNGWKDTIECIQSLVNIKNCNYKIVIVDNCSTDNSLDNLLKWTSSQFHDNFVRRNEHSEYDFGSLQVSYSFSGNILNKGLREFSVILSKENNGYSAGNNIGIRYALQHEDTKFIWVLNNDTIVSDDSLHKMLELFTQAKDNNNKLGIVGLKLLYYDDPTVIQCLGGGIYNPYSGIIHQIGNGHKNLPASQLATKKKVDYISGASMLVAKEFIDDIGLLEEKYFLYFEELDWATRGRKKGWGLDYTLDSYLLHKEGNSIGGGRNKSKSKLADYCFLRSKIIYTKKFESVFCNFLLYIVILASLSLRVVRGQYDRLPIMLKILIDPNSKKFLLRPN